MVSCDAHAHPGGATELAIRKQCRIATFLCATDPETAAAVQELCRGSEILFPTFGLHPWYADKFRVEEMLPFLHQGNLLGEIGMDNVWCEADLNVQRQVLVEQLNVCILGLNPSPFRRSL